MIAARSAPVKANVETCVAGMVFAVAAVAAFVVVVLDVDGETVVPKTLEVLAAKFVPVPSKVASKNWPPALRVVVNVTCPPGPTVLVPISTGSVQVPLEQEKKLTTPVGLVGSALGLPAVTVDVNATGWSATGGLGETESEVVVESVNWPKLEYTK
jgi:hypothetical protein